jgi:hypothetical protein
MLPYTMISHSFQLSFVVGCVIVALNFMLEVQATRASLTTKEAFSPAFDSNHALLGRSVLNTPGELEKRQTQRCEIPGGGMLPIPPLTPLSHLSQSAVLKTQPSAVRWVMIAS